ncbi:ATPase involved in DNA repair [Cenarchaeum symbiosum A]|uniref:ATPase involved in DNA repair n=1 Tax=Cenarchaeum symbiosum (strain A) TaxID=414004 RepID=A0RW70_CENSY|nr:ATPase involved in DNA repair [Cenarchaeum symbiosum A]
MGIEFALFGLGSQKSEALLAKRAESGGVRLKFSVGGRSYEVGRYLKRNKKGLVSQDPKRSYLDTGDATESLSPSELKQRVMRILGFNEPESAGAVSRIYRYAVFTPQEEMKYVLSDRDRRLETVRRAFGIEEYSTASENARQAASWLRTEMARLEGRFADISRHEAAVRDSGAAADAARSRIAGLEDALGGAKARLVSAEAALKSVQERLDRSASLGARRRELESSLSSERGRLKLIVSRIAAKQAELNAADAKIRGYGPLQKPTEMGIREMDGLLEGLRKVGMELGGLAARRDEQAGQVAQSEARLGGQRDAAAAEKERLDLAALQSDVAAALDLNRAHLGKLRESMAGDRRVRAELEGDLERFRTMVGTCPYCESEITEEHRGKMEGERSGRLADIDGRLGEMGRESERLGTLVSEGEAEAKRLSGETDRLAGLVRDIMEYERRSSGLADTQSRIRELEGEASRLGPGSTDARVRELMGGGDPISALERARAALVEYEKAQSAINEARRAKAGYERDLQDGTRERTDVEASIGARELELGETEKEMRRFEGLEEEKDRCAAECGRISGEISGGNAGIAASREALRNGEAGLAEGRARLEDAKKWRDRHRVYSDYREWMEKFYVPSLDRIEKRMMINIRAEFEAAYQGFYHSLVDDPSKESRIDEEFAPLVEQDGYEQEVEYLSGGERTSIGLAYRLALNSLMRRETSSLESGLLILDEPTDGFSEAQITKVVSVLKSMESKQVILVSHKGDLGNSADHTFKISKPSGTSEISVED